MSEKDEWKKIGKRSEYEYFIHEKDLPREKPIISLSSIRTETRNINPSKQIKILSIDVPSKILDIIATKDGELAGFLEASILEDGTTASMSMQTQLSKMELPKDVNDTKLNVHRHNGAVFVDEDYRRHGVAKNMMNELLKRLKEFGVKKLNIHDIKEDAIELYRTTGAEFSSEKEATYNIEEMVIEEPKNSLEM